MVMFELPMIETQKRIFHKLGYYKAKSCEMKDEKKKFKSVNNETKYEHINMVVSW